MEVFHGTTLIVDTPLVGVGRKNLDFGMPALSLVKRLLAGCAMRNQITKYA